MAWGRNGQKNTRATRKKRKLAFLANLCTSWILNAVKNRVSTFTSKIFLPTFLPWRKSGKPRWFMGFKDPVTRLKICWRFQSPPPASTHENGNSVCALLLECCDFADAYIRISYLIAFVTNSSTPPVFPWSLLWKERISQTHNHFRRCTCDKSFFYSVVVPNLRIFSAHT